MAMKIRWVGSFFLTALVSTVLQTALAAIPSVEEEHERLVAVNLENLRQTEVANRSVKAIEELNLRAISKLLQMKITRQNSDRIRSVDPETAEKMLRSIELHPVVSHFAIQKYNTKCRGIGFCFGRATYAHLMALDLGVQKEALKKAFVVGPMNSGSITWGFHVATLIRSGNDWLALDSVPGKKPLTITEWFRHFEKTSADGKLRLYITEPEKFTTAPLSYTQIQLGLKMSREHDWYSGYFQDLMDWFSKEPNYTELNLEPPSEFKARLTKNPFEPVKKEKSSFLNKCMTFLSR